MVTLLKNVRLVTGGRVLKNQTVAVRAGVIEAVIPDSAIGLPNGAETVDLQGDYLSPGWIDLHCHGGGGAEFIEGKTEAAVEICRVHARHGTRLLYPTISATDFQTTWNALSAIERARADCPLEIPGVHLEGPYLAPGMCGAQDCQHLTAPIPAEYNALIHRFGPLIARWTYAPERDRDGAFLAALRENKIVPSMGHSEAEYNDVLAAWEGGCRLVTHLYSCTSTITRHGGFRRLGIIESAYLMDDMAVEAIGDGCHLPPELMRLIVKMKGPGRVCLITDAIGFAGMPAGETPRGKAAYLIEEGVAKLPDRSAFAGSIATTDVLLRQTVAAGIPLADTVHMMTGTPARVMGLSGRGEIAPGCAARFTRWNENGVRPGDFLT